VASFGEGRRAKGLTGGWLLSEAESESEVELTRKGSKRLETGRERWAGVASAWEIVWTGGDGWRLELRRAVLVRDEWEALLGGANLK
jgi:hypothetical protein